MQTTLNLFLLIIISYNYSFSNCDFNIDIIDPIDKRIKVDVKEELIFSSDGQTLEIGFGTINLDFFYLKLIPSLHDEWEVNSDTEVIIKYKKRSSLLLHLAEFHSSNSLAESAGSSHLIERNIILPLSQSELDELYKNDIESISIQFPDGEEMFKLKRKYSAKHLDLIDCLDEKIKYWKQCIIYDGVKLDRRTLIEKYADSTIIIDNNEDIYKELDFRPLFPGCDFENQLLVEQVDCSKKRMKEFFLSNLNYPIEAQNNSTEGVVVIQFVVEKNGSISRAKIVRDLKDGCGEEALRLVKLMNKMPNKWDVGFQRGEPVRVVEQTLIRFQL